MKAEFIRLGTDRGGSIEIVLRPDQYKRPGEKSVTISTPTGGEFKYDHPKDVSEFLKLSLGEILGIVDKLVDEERAKVRNSRQRSYNEDSDLRRIRHLELD